MSRRAGSTTVEVPGSHAIYVSQPGAVVELIETAAETIDPPPESDRRETRAYIRSAAARSAADGKKVTL
jgi:hypothetical protein